MTSKRAASRPWFRCGILGASPGNRRAGPSPMSWIRTGGRAWSLRRRSKGIRQDDRIRQHRLLRDVVPSPDRRFLLTRDTPQEARGFGRPGVDQSQTPDWGPVMTGAVAWSPDGGRLAVAANDRTIRLFKVTPGDTSRLQTPPLMAGPTLRRHSDNVQALAWNLDGTVLVSGGDKDDPTLRLWNPETADLLKVLDAHTVGVRRIAWSPDGRSFFSYATDASDTRLRIWQADGSPGPILNVPRVESSWPRGAPTDRGSPLAQQKG